MKISIAARLSPFSHLPGTALLLPGTSIQLRAYPAMLIFKDLALGEGAKEVHHPLEVEGPLRPFTVEQDLEKAEVRLHGKGPQGYVLFKIEAQEKGVRITSKGKEEWMVPIKTKKMPLRTEERLSLGMHRAQDWEMVMRRGDLREILPLFLRLAAWSPESSKCFCPRTAPLRR